MIQKVKGDMGMVTSFLYPIDFKIFVLDDENLRNFVYVDKIVNDANEDTCVHRYNYDRNSDYNDYYKNKRIAGVSVEVVDRHD